MCVALHLLQAFAGCKYARRLAAVPSVPTLVSRRQIDMYFGKGLVSKKLYEQVYAACEFPRISAKCELLLERASVEMGPHNVYNIYDNVRALRAGHAPRTHQRTHPAPPYMPHALYRPRAA